MQESTTARPAIDHMPLLRGLRGLIYRDRPQFKQDLFEKFLDCHPVLSACFALANAGRFFRQCSVSVYYLVTVCLLDLGPDKPFLTMLVHTVEYDAFDRVIARKERVALARKRLAGLLAARPLSLKRCATLTRIIARLLRRYDLYVVLRAAEYLACYSRLYAGASSRRLNGLLLFTDANPHGFALMAVAQRLRLPLYFISHGEPHAPIYPLRCQGALLLGEESLRRYEAAGSTFAQVQFLGHKSVYRPFSPIDPDKALSVGCFLGKLSSLRNLRTILEQLVKQFRVRSVLIRLHPNVLFNERLRPETLVPAPVQVVPSTSLKEDVERCDLIISGNSTAQIEVLLHGKASLFCKELDDGRDDLYGYLADGLTMAWSPGLTVHDINAFYGRSRREAIHQRLSLRQTADESIAGFNRYVFGN